MNRVVSIVFEHIMWCKRKGMSPKDVLDALGYPFPPKPSWHDAVAAVHREIDELSLARRRRRVNARL